MSHLLAFHLDKDFQRAWHHPRFPRRTDGKPEWFSVLEWDAKKIPGRLFAKPGGQTDQAERKVVAR